MAIYTSLPFLVLFQLGFLYVGLSSLLQGKFFSKPTVEPLPVAKSTERMVA